MDVKAKEIQYKLRIACQEQQRPLPIQVLNLPKTDMKALVVASETRWADSRPKQIPQIAMALMEKLPVEGLRRREMHVELDVILWQIGIQERKRCGWGSGD